MASGRPWRLTGDDRQASPRIYLLHAKGWRDYRSDGYRWVRLSYLFGRDDNGSGPWAVRVPGTLTTVAGGLEWITPAQVRKARGRVRRQGDVYAIETTDQYDGAGAKLLPASHEWRPRTRYLVHRPDDGRKHAPLRLTWPVRFVQQRTLAMGRGNGWANGD